MKLLPRFPLALLALAGPTLAHVELTGPTGGQLLVPGTTATIEWRIDIAHETENWDLEVSLSGPTGPWIPIATDLPPGDIEAGAVHTFAWTVPDAATTDAFVRVVQDNVGTDWDDTNDTPFTIGSAAEVVLRNGTGVNVSCFDAPSPPVLGATWTSVVSHGHHPGAIATVIFGYAAPATGPVVPAGEVLVDLGSPRLVLRSTGSSGSADSHTVAIPNDLTLVGRQGFFQAAIVGGGSTELCNALDATLGF